MSWNIQKPGDYINGPLTVTGTATLASAIITGDLTVKTNVLKVDSVNERFGFRTASPAYDFDINGVVNLKDAVIHRIGGNPMFARVGAANSYLYAGTTGLIIRNNADSATFATFDGSGNVGIGVVPTAGVGCLQLVSGVNFPATQVANANANTLDDYEEGTWTPVFADASTGGNTATAASAVGIYTKIGNIVTVQYQIESINTTGLTAGNVAYIRGLPFSVISTPASPGHVMTGNVAFGGFLSSNCVNGGTQILFYDCLTGGLLSTRVVSNFTSGTSSIYGSFSYRVA